jgi:hypothetical protein
MSAMGDSRSTVHIDVDEGNYRHVPVLVVCGVLDNSTYRTIRDAVIKAALDEPSAVVVDVSRLSAAARSAWTVFTSARWHVSVWPDVPILLVCADPETHRSIIASGVTRYVPLHPTRASALDAIADLPSGVRRRARTQLPRSRGSVDLAREVVAGWLTAWNTSELIPVAAIVATVLAENVLQHTQSAPVLIVELHDGTATVAVEDCSDRLPSRHEDPERGADIVSGLAIVSALCRTWGATPTSSGKTVWALVGRENRF